MKVFDRNKLSLGTIDVLKALQRRKIVSVVMAKNLIGVARCHVNHGKDSPFKKKVEELSAL